MKRVVIRNSAETVPLGKTKLHVTADGCVRCGTEQSTGWHVDRTLHVGKRQIPVLCCDECEKAKEPALFG